MSSTQTTRKGRLRALFASRRGVASVLAMMFLIIFGSLVAAMGVASTGNVRTAATHLRVMRAMSAAETGLEIAEARLNEAAGRFVVAESDIDATMTTALWDGDAATIGDYTVMSAPSGYAEGGLPSGVMEALLSHHDADENIVTGAEFIDEPVTASAPADADTGVYRATNWLYTPAIALELPEAEGALPPAYQIRYAPLADGEHIRIIVDGIVFDDMRSGQPIRRTISRDYRLIKTVDQAIISPNRIMIGKNVLVEGNLGARYMDVSFNNGDPLVLKSDFEGIDGGLDTKLQLLYDALAAGDVDGDNRLRVGHPTRRSPLTSKWRMKTSNSST